MRCIGSIVESQQYVHQIARVLYELRHVSTVHEQEHKCDHSFQPFHLLLPHCIADKTTHQAVFVRVEAVSSMCDILRHIHHKVEFAAHYHPIHTPYSQCFLPVLSLALNLLVVRVQHGQEHPAGMNGL